MNHILLISENRVLLKQLFTYLEGKYDFAIYVVPCSSNAFERFAESRADVVLLDTDVGIPYRTILQQLQQSQRNYHIILLSEFVEPAWDDPRVLFLNKASLTPDLLLSTLQNIAKDVPEDEDAHGEKVNVLSGHFEFVSYPDAYYIMFIKYVGPGSVEMDEKTVANLKTAMVLVGECETVAVSRSDMLLLLRKSKMRVGFEFTKLPKIVTGTLGRNYAVIYAENINWRKLEQVCSRLESLSKYTYFLKKESIEMNELTNRVRTLSHSELHETLVLLLHSILLRETAQVKDCLNEIYLHRLKESMDFYSLSYVRCNMQIISNLISSIVNVGLDGREDFSSIELEFDTYEQRLTSFIKDISRKSALNALVVEATTDIYKRYSEDISLAGIAQDLNVNKVYLSRLFREQTGITVLDLLQTIRIQNAKFLLLYSNIKISAIARSVGYMDAGYFSRIFRKHTQFSPEDFRSGMKERKELL